MSADSIGATGLAGRYATALFDLAEADKQLDRISGDLGQLGRMIEESSDLTRLIRSPAISRQDQGRAMAVVLDELMGSEAFLCFGPDTLAEARNRARQAPISD